MRVSKYEPIRYPSVTKNNIIIVRRNPTVAKKMPTIPAIIAPRIALFTFIMCYNTEFLWTVNSTRLSATFLFSPWASFFDAFGLGCSYPAIDFRLSQLYPYPEEQDHE